MQEANRPAGYHPPRGANIKGWRASDELFHTSCEPAADASHHGRGGPGILLCSATGFGGFESRSVRPAFNNGLTEARSKIAEPVDSAGLLGVPEVVAL